MCRSFNLKATVAMNKRDLASIGSTLVIPGAGMELYELSLKLAYESHFSTLWECAKFFFLGVACIAAVFELCKRIAETIDSASAVMMMTFSMLYVFFGGIVFLIRGLFGYGWSLVLLYLIGGLVLLFAVSSILLMFAQAREAKEKAEKEKELLATGGPEAVKKQREANAIAAAEGRAWVRTLSRGRE